MKILGIDPGTRNLGFCILDFDNKKFRLLEAGVIKFKNIEQKERIMELSIALDTLFTSHTIDEVAIENIFFANSPQSILKLAQFRGAICLKVLLEVGDYTEYSALQVKQAITGNGKATKEQVAFMVKRLLNIKKEIKPYDITDAMAIAITHTQRLRLKKRKDVNNF